jgi:hypothetical protein
VDQFLASLTAADWIAAGLAVLALAVSGINVVQNHRFQPRPHFDIMMEPVATENEYGVMTILCFITNDGDAIARNVRVEVSAPWMRDRTGTRKWAVWQKLSPDQHAEMLRLPAEPCMRQSVGLGVHELFPLGERLPPGTPRARAERPTITIRYRGRLLPIRKTASAVEPVPTFGGC